VDTIDTSYRPLAPSLKREWNLRIDLRWCERLGLAQGDRISARALAQRIQDRADDLTDLYPEMPADGTAQRTARLHRGLALYLQDNVQ
jgi:hypothetical protein